MKGRIHWYNDPDEPESYRTIVTDDIQRWETKLRSTNEHFISYPKLIFPKGK